MLSAFANSFKIPELRQRILFTLGLLFICRVVTTVPTPGVDAAAVRCLETRLPAPRATAPRVYTFCTLPD